MKRFVKQAAWSCFGMILMAGCVPTGGGSSTTAVTDTVMINQMKFQPAELYVNKGDTVVWINADIVGHDVTEFPDKAWSSDTIQPEMVWKTVIYDNTDYFCSIHPTMKAKIVVRE